MTSAKAKIKVRFFRLRNRLKDKAAGLGGGDFTIAKEALEKAEAEIKKMAEDYPDWVAGYVPQLYRELRGAQEKPPESRTPYFKRVAALAHELKGQGGTFGYPLITTFGQSLFEFASTSEGRVADDQIEIAKSHVDGIQAVIKNRVSGDGGALGAELVRALKQAIEKYQKKP
jgi:hypothetical protein